MILLSFPFQQSMIGRINIGFCLYVLCIFLVKEVLKHNWVRTVTIQSLSNFEVYININNCTHYTLHKMQVIYQFLKNNGNFDGLMVKNLPTMREDLGLSPGRGRCSGEGNGYPLQYSYLENSMDRGAWQATVHAVSESQTQLS